MEAQFTSHKAGNDRADRTVVRSSRRRAWLVTSNVAASLVVLVAGCSSWDTGSNWSRSTSSSNSNLAFGEEGQQLDKTRSYIKQAARQADLPEQFVSEARIGMAEVERSLANARAIDVESQANLREQQAKISAHRQEASSREQIAFAEAENRRKQANAEQSRLYASVSARQRDLESTVAKNEALAETLLKERETIYADMASQADSEFSQSQARIDKLRTIRQTTEAEGIAAIEDRRERSHTTRTRGTASALPGDLPSRRRASWAWRRCASWTRLALFRSGRCTPGRRSRLPRRCGWAGGRSPTSGSPTVVPSPPPHPSPPGQCQIPCTVSGGRRLLLAPIAHHLAHH